MLIRLNVIDREGKKTVIDIEEGTTIRDAIEETYLPITIVSAVEVQKISNQFKTEVSTEKDVEVTK